MQTTSKTISICMLGSSLLQPKLLIESSDELLRLPVNLAPALTVLLFYQERGVRHSQWPHRRSQEARHHVNIITGPLVRV